MKKLLALLLILTCAFFAVACKDSDNNNNNGDDQNNSQDNNQNGDQNNDSVVTKDIIDKLGAMFRASTPTKSVVTTTQTSGEVVLTGEYVLTTGTIGGKAASTYKYDYERLISVDESGALDYVTGTIVKESLYKEYLEGYGVRENGGVWDAAKKDFAPQNGPMSLNLSSELITDFEYDTATKTFTCTVAKNNTAAVLGREENLDVDITLTLVDDGASITSVNISYQIPARNKNEAPIDIVINAVYTYNLEVIKINVE